MEGSSMVRLGEGSSNRISKNKRIKNKNLKKATKKAINDEKKHMERNAELSAICI